MIKINKITFKIITNKIMNNKTCKIYKTSKFKIITISLTGKVLTISKINKTNKINKTINKIKINIISISSSNISPYNIILNKNSRILTINKEYKRNKKIFKNSRNLNRVNRNKIDKMEQSRKNPWINKNQIIKKVNKTKLIRKIIKVLSF